MRMVDILEVLIEEEIQYQLDSLNPTYTVHLYDSNGVSHGCMIDAMRDDSEIWDIVMHTRISPVYFRTQDELRSWIKNYLK